MGAVTAVIVSLTRGSSHDEDSTSWSLLRATSPPAIATSTVDEFLQTEEVDAVRLPAEMVQRTFKGSMLSGVTLR